MQTYFSYWDSAYSFRFGFACGILLLLLPSLASLVRIIFVCYCIRFLHFANAIYCMQIVIVHFVAAKWSILIKYIIIYFLSFCISVFVCMCMCVCVFAYVRSETLWFHLLYSCIFCITISIFFMFPASRGLPFLHVGFSFSLLHSNHVYPGKIKQSCIGFGMACNGTTHWTRRIH